MGLLFEDLNKEWYIRHIYIYIFSILKDFTKYIEPKFSSTLNSNDLPILGSYYFETKSSELLHAYFMLFFTFNLKRLRWEKTIPSFEVMMVLFTPCALSFLIQDDGSRTPFGLVICTDCFSLEQVKLLVQVLTIKFNLSCTIRKTRKLNPQYRIYIRSQSMPMLRSLTMDWIDPSMLYKIT